MNKEECLICLQIIDVEIDSISINSTQWLELDITRKIEKHFWSLIKINSKSVVCALCWKELNNFDIFYLRIEKAHLSKIKPGVVTVECKDELVTQLPNNVYNDAELLGEDNLECYILEPEILIEQCQSHDMPKEVPKDKSVTEPVDDVLLTQGRKHFTSWNDEEDNDPLEKIEAVSAKTLRKRKQVKIETQVVQNSTEEKKVTKPSDNRRINREEFDKFIEKYFKQINCSICQIPLENFSATQKHFLVIHQKKGYLLCCNRKFFKRRDLVDHIHSHLNPNHFKCAKCDKILSDRVRLEKHEMSVHGGVKLKHCCDTCSKSFLEIRDLNMHKLTHLSEDEKKFPCKECGKFYGSSYLLHRHTQAVHLKKFVKICYICGKSLSSSTELKIHMNIHAETPQPLFNCDICGLRLTTERGLKRHKDSQHPADGKKDHHCPICPKISPTLKALRKHINTMHEKGYDHKCSICQKAFKRAEVLREHMASHTDTPLYTCPWCPKTFNSNGNMHAHRKKIHPKEWEAKLQKYSGNIKVLDTSGQLDLTKQ